MPCAATTTRLSAFNRRAELPRPTPSTGSCSPQPSAASQTPAPMSANTARPRRSATKPFNCLPKKSRSISNTPSRPRRPGSGEIEGARRAGIGPASPFRKSKSRPRRLRPRRRALGHGRPQGGASAGSRRRRPGSQLRPHLRRRHGLPDPRRSRGEAAFHRTAAAARLAIGAMGAMGAMGAGRANGHSACAERKLRAAPNSSVANTPPRGRSRA